MLEETKQVKAQLIAMAAMKFPILLEKILSRSHEISDDFINKVNAMDSEVDVAVEMIAYNIAHCDILCRFDDIQEGKNGG